MLEVYVFIAIVCTVGAILSFAYNTLEWADNRNRHTTVRKDYAKDSARNALLSLAAIIPIWLWPLTIPALLVYLVYVLFKEATVSDQPTD